MCFGCGVTTQASKLTDVGDGAFCQPCLAALLAAPGPDSQSAVAEAPEKARADTPGVRRCFVCESACRANEQKLLFGRDICATCLVAVTAVEQEEQPPPAKGDQVEPSTIEEEPEGLRQTPGSQTVSCEGCERLMPGPGSYRVLDGKRYCAGCLPFYQRLSAGNHNIAGKQETAISVGVQNVEATGAARAKCCECCERSLSVNDRDNLTGFSLCRACLEVDAGLARAVAVARHRRLLNRLNVQFSRAEDEQG